MSNVAISQLPLTTSVCSTALVPIVQDGVTCSTYACLLGGGGGGGGVTQITAGSGICISPVCGTGNVTICSTGGGGGVMASGAGTCSIQGSGSNNLAIGNCSFAASGFSNTACGNYALALGGFGNLSKSGGLGHALIGNGCCNIVCGSFASVVNGSNNYACGFSSSIVGGASNRTTSSANYGFVGGGFGNFSCGASSSVVGGESNCGVGACSFIGGGRLNCAIGASSTISGGYCNLNNTCYSFIGGGFCNSVCNSSGIIVGGCCNKLICNDASNGRDVIIGGLCNCVSTCSTVFNFIGNGLRNCIMCPPAGLSYVSGGSNTIVNSSGSCIFGYSNAIVSGSVNTSCSSFGFIGNGEFNFIGGNCCYGVGVTALSIFNSSVNGCDNKISGATRFGQIFNGFCNCIAGDSSQTIGDICGNAAFTTIVNGCCNKIAGCFGTASGYCNCIMGGPPFFNVFPISATVIGACNTVCVDPALACYGGNFTTIIGCGITGCLSCTLYVNNFVATGVKSFQIPHPDPIKSKCGCMLRHSTVESPTAGDNIYRFNIKTNNCSASIELPDYYNLLNNNDQVFINAKNHLGYGYGIINKEQTKIDITTNSDGEYNVLIIGTRKDKGALDGWTGVE